MVTFEVRVKPAPVIENVNSLNDPAALKSGQSPIDSIERYRRDMSFDSSVDDFGGRVFFIPGQLAKNLDSLMGQPQPALFADFLKAFEHLFERWFAVRLLHSKAFLSNHSYPGII